jgi:uncharacterized membrane protein YidH (DUF202 family)
MVRTSTAAISFFVGLQAFVASNLISTGNHIHFRPKRKLDYVFLIYIVTGLGRYFLVDLENLRWQIQNNSV